MPAHASRTLAPAPSAPPSRAERRLLAPVRPRHRPASAATPAELSASPAARPVKLRSVDSGFGGSNVDDEPFNATTFSKNRERLLEAEVARAFFAEVMAEAGRRRLLSDDHFSVDGTLLEAWASLKSYRPRDEQEPPSSGAGRNAEVDFRGQRSQSRDARLAHRRGGAALPQGTAAGGEAALPGPRPQREPSRAGGGRGAERGERLYGEREAALQMLERSVRGRATLGADRGYDTRDFVAAVRARGVTPHVARNDRGRRSAIDGRTTRHAGYGQSLRRRELVEEVFGWLKTVGGGASCATSDGSAIAPGWS